MKTNVMKAGRSKYVSSCHFRAKMDFPSLPCSRNFPIPNRKSRKCGKFFIMASSGWLSQLLHRERNSIRTKPPTKELWTICSHFLERIKSVTTKLNITDVWPVFGMLIQVEQVTCWLENLFNPCLIFLERRVRKYSYSSRTLLVDPV